MPDIPKPIMIVYDSLKHKPVDTGHSVEVVLSKLQRREVVKVDLHSF